MVHYTNPMVTQYTRTGHIWLQRQSFHNLRQPYQSNDTHWPNQLLTKTSPLQVYPISHQSWEDDRRLFWFAFECSVIYRHTELPSLLLNENYGWSVRGATWANPALLQVLIQLPTYLRQLGSRYSVLPPRWRGSTWQKFNSVYCFPNSRHARRFENIGKFAGQFVPTRRFSSTGRPLSHLTQCI